MEACREFWSEQTAVTGLVSGVVLVYLVFRASCMLNSWFFLQLNSENWNTLHTWHSKGKLTTKLQTGPQEQESESLWDISLPPTPSKSYCCCQYQPVVHVAAMLSSAVTFLPSVHTSFPLEGNVSLSHLYVSVHTAIRADSESEDKFEREEMIKVIINQPGFLSYTTESKNYLPATAPETLSGF